MPRNPEWFDTIFKPLARGMRRRDPWPEGYRIIVRVRMLTRIDAIALARTFQAWPIHTHTGAKFIGLVSANDPRLSSQGWRDPSGQFAASPYRGGSPLPDGRVPLFLPWPVTVPAFTPEEAADLWAAGDDWVATNWQPPADFTGTVINPTGEGEHRVKGCFEWRDPEDTKYFDRPREDR